MLNNSKNSISDQELDNLLKQAFLNLDTTNPKNDMIMETISTQYVSSGNTLMTTLKSIMFNKLFIGIIITLATAIGIILSYPFKTITTTPVSQTITTIHANETPRVIEINKQSMPFTSKQNEQLQHTVTKSVMAVEQPYITEPSQSNSQQNQPVYNELLLDKPKVYEDTSYIYPKLTPKEIRVNNKNKEVMIALLQSGARNMYAFMPIGTFTCNGEPVSLNSFYIQKLEVTNREYRTFLFDLLIQGRKEEFLKAKPDQAQWEKGFDGKGFDSTCHFSHYTNNYFSQKMYNEYPVVNISREGAEMYCKWLTQETNTYLASKNKPLMNDLRIPSNHEWVYAAKSAGLIHDTIPYPWNRLTARNQRGCFLANFNIKNLGEIKVDPKASCVKDEYRSALTSAGLILGIFTLTVPVYSYNPNDAGLYCMSGNIAEMVYDEDLKTKSRIPSTKGGSWNSDEEHIKLNSESEFKNQTKASPMIGFRPVFTYVSQK